MPTDFKAKASTTIHASADKVWEALTDPKQIKQYLFGTEAKSDWKKGSKITYSGEWEGKKYEDKGEIVEIIPQQILHTTYWSSMSGKEDKPENYNNVVYELSEMGDSTKLTITQDNNATEESAAHSEKNWNQVLESMKNLLES
ncbi:MAG: SRPBCC domain-containing protein [Sphingobacteriales bacterium]|nr:MAG: SRPBCC domain-containing protein [Sphingobacteriales bacterium]